MSLSSFSFIPENVEAYAKCHEILGLPEEVQWSKLQVTFGAGEFGEVTLALIPTGEQVRDLAELAIQQIADNCLAPDVTVTRVDPHAPYVDVGGTLVDISNPAAPTIVEQSVMHSDPDMGPAG